MEKITIENETEIKEIPTVLIGLRVRESKIKHIVVHSYGPNFFHWIAPPQWNSHPCHELVYHL